MDQNHACPYCGAAKTIAKGFRHNKTGPVPLRRCKSCGRRWTVNAGSSEEPYEQPSMTVEISASTATESVPDGEPRGAGVAEPSTPSAPMDSE